MVSFGQVSGLLELAGGAILGRPALSSSVEARVGPRDKRTAIAAAWLIPSLDMCTRQGSERNWSEARAQNSGRPSQFSVNAGGGMGGGMGGWVGG